MNRIELTLKKIAVICCVFICCTSCNKIDVDNDSIYIYIPDSIFESKLISLGIDSDGIINQQILKTDAAEVNVLNLNSKGDGEINSLTGIEGFINLRKLAAVQNSLTNIDLSFNKELDTLYLMGNYLTSIDISNNPKLLLLDLTSNDLSSIVGLANLSLLKKLRLSFNLLEDISIHNEQLETLLISDNLLNSLDVTGAIKLKSILMKTNKVTTLDFSSNILLKTLVLSDNKIQNINIEQNSNLTQLYIFSNLLTNLDVSHLQKLVHLIVDNNPDLTCIKINSGQNITIVSKSEYQELNSICN